MKTNRTNSKSARGTASGLLAARQYSAAGLTRKLLERGYDDAEVGAVVDEFTELGYLDDLEFARSIIRHYKDKGLHRVRYELYKRGIGRETGAEALEILEEDGDLF
ncbi:MAG: recombination regulator RecX [Oscillospiraceae bacterium]|nr:recombination regulator RecX [Oscillospiraceae bacterium]